MLLNTETKGEAPWGGRLENPASKLSWELLGEIHSLSFASDLTRRKTLLLERIFCCFFFPSERSFPWAWVPRVLGWDGSGSSGALTAMNYRGCSWSGTGSRMELRSREQECRWNHSSPTPGLWRGAPGTLTVISTGFLTPRALGKSSCAFCCSAFLGFKILSRLKCWTQVPLLL